MIFGRTQQEKDAAYNALFIWHRWFAWHPVPLNCGRVAWLEWCQRKKLPKNYSDGRKWEYHNGRGFR